jgi:hypothetical protein
MYIQLTTDETYKSQKVKKGNVIEVGNALGDMLVLSGHIKVQSKEDSSSNLLSDEELDSLGYEDLKELISTLEIETVDNKKVTYLSALKSYYKEVRG